MRKVGQWALARRAVENMAGRMRVATDKATRQEALLFRNLVVKAFNTRGRSNGKEWVKLAKSTIRKKGSSKQLVDSAQLRNSIAVIDRGREIFVGVSSNKTRKGGGPLVNIAAVHEYGKVIAQRRGGRVRIIKIPKRSFLQATADYHFKPAAVRQRFNVRVGALMGPGWSGKVSTAGELAQSGKLESKAKGV